jgi:hypothetical protein
MPIINHNFRGDPFNLEDKYPDWEIKPLTPDRPPKLVFFGEGNTVVEYDGCHESGYDKPEAFFALDHWHYDSFLKYRDPKHWEGVPWIDKRACIKTIKGFSWFFKGPMVNVKLQPGEIDKLPEVDPWFAKAMHPTNQALLAIGKSTAKTQKAGSMDMVDVATYVRGWVEHGAVAGFIRDGYFIVEPYAKGTIYHHYQDVYKRHGRKAARAMECASESGIHWWLFMHCTDKQIEDFCSWYGVKETRIMSDHDCTGKWFSGAPTIRRSGHRVLVTLSWGYDI